MISAILVYDVGTTSVKSALFDLSGNLLFSVSVPYPTTYLNGGWAQQKADDYWQAVIEGTELLRENPSWREYSIEAVSLTGHMNGTLCVDEKGDPVHPQIIHSDTRSISQVEKILDRVTDQRELYRTSGNRMDEFLSLPKLLWIRDEAPEAFRRCRFVINSKDYIRSRLTGVIGTTDFSDASLTGAFSMKRRGWNQELIKAVGLSAEIFPEIHPSFHVDGYISRASAALLGLKEGIPVATGGGDAACATRGAMIEGEEETYISLGSSSWMSMLRETVEPDELMRMQHFYDLDGQRINVCGTSQAAGTATDWARKVFLEEGEIKEWERRLSELPIGNRLITLPYLQGERTPHWDPYARGAVVGLSAATTAEEIARSWYEAVAFALRDIWEVYRDLGMHPRKLTVLGGGAVSDFWLQMIADVFAIDVIRHPFYLHATSYGAALAGLAAAGAYSTIDEALRATRREGTKIPHDGKSHTRYMKYYSLYTRMYEQMKPLYREIATLEKENT